MRESLPHAHKVIVIVMEEVAQNTENGEFSDKTAARVVICNFLTMTFLEF